MKTSLPGLMAIIQHEAIVLSPYRDVKDIWTIGVGHTKSAGGLNPETVRGKLTLEQAIELFQVDIAKFERRVTRAFTRPLKQHEFDAAVSFDFNTGAIDRATWVKSFNAGKRGLAVEQIMNWVKPQSLFKRRQSEQLLFDKGVYPSPLTAKVYDASPNGAVLWKTGRTVDLSKYIGGSFVKEPLKPRNPPELDYVPQDVAPKPQIAWGRILSIVVVFGIIIAILKGL